MLSCGESELVRVSEKTKTIIIVIISCFFLVRCGKCLFLFLQNWSDAIKKAKSLYGSLKSHQGFGGHLPQTPTTMSISRQHSGYANEDISIGDNVEENKTMTYNLGLWAGKSPKGSSYGSRISSLVHSHR